jgi:hypothetical protein
MEDYRQRLERKLNQTAARNTLLRAAALLIGWELIQSDVIDKVRDFFTFGFNESGPVVDRKYRERVTSRAPRLFDASVQWLVEANALTVDQASRLKDLRGYRNSVAHELAKYLVDPDLDIDLSKLEAMRDVVGSLGRFWGQIEVDTNPDFDGQDVEPQDIKSGYMLLFDFVISACLGDEKY